MCTHYFSDDMLWWYFKQKWKNNWDHSHFNQFQLTASTVLIQQIPFLFSRYRSLAYILMSGPTNASYILTGVSYNSAGIPKRFYALFLPLCILSRCRLNRRKLNTYRATRPPSWENGTWQVPSQFSHSDISFSRYMAPISGIWIGVLWILQIQNFYSPGYNTPNMYDEQ